MVGGIIFQTLRGLVDNRCYPGTFPQPEVVPQWPAIRYSISSDAIADLCGTDLGETDNYSVQFDVVAKTDGAATVLRDQVVAALVLPLWIREFESRNLYDADTKTFRIILSYSYHPSSSLGALGLRASQIESTAVSDACDAAVPVTAAARVESAGIVDVSSFAASTLAASVDEIASVSDGVGVAPVALEVVAILDLSAATVSTLAARLEVVFAHDTPAAPSSGTNPTRTESGALGDAVSAIATRSASRSESAAVSETQSLAGVTQSAARNEATAIADVLDATVDVFAGLAVAWMRLFEPAAVPGQMFVSWASIEMPEEAGSAGPPEPTRAFVAWVAIEVPEEGSPGSGSAGPDTQSFVSWAEIEIPEPST